MQRSSITTRTAVSTKKTPTSTFKIILLVFSCLLILGIFFSATMAPNESEASSGPSTNSILSSSTNSFDHSKPSLTQKIFDWLPKHTVRQNLKPDYSQEFWTPIDVEISSDPVVILCKLNFQKYSEAPHSYPMFKDLESNSYCIGRNRKRERMSILLKEIEDSKDDPKFKIIKPSGFVFHESRVGSTLVANFLASDLWSLVFSESTPPANALLHCDSCSRDRQIQLFRDVVTLMGRSPIHTRLFFKFQSITVTKMEIALEAFPDTPWAFVYRQPIQTMMSHLDPLKGKQAAPCLRSMRSPPVEVSNTVISVTGKSRGAPNEAWCAAHLNMLCNKALQAYERFGYYANINNNSTPSTSTNAWKPRGLLINYESLPGIVAHTVLPFFGIYPTENWIKKMKEESQMYSKSRGTSFRIFSGDSKDKDERATALIQLYSSKILTPTYSKLNIKALETLSSFNPSMYNELVLKDGDPLRSNGSEVMIHWKSIAEIPDEISILHAYGQSNEDSSMTDFHGGGGGSGGHEPGDVIIPHSTIHAVNYNQLAPFINHHSSRRIEAVNCPDVPSDDYPKAHSMIDIVTNWNTDNTDIPAIHYDTLCHFNFQNATQLRQAYTYRDKEVPFIAYNIPDLDSVTSHWNDLDYLNHKLGKKLYRTETSTTNHFMYWRNAGTSFLRTKEGSKWKPPTNVVNTNFEKWLELAVKGHNKSLEDRNHQYFRVSSDSGNDWLFNELPFFKPVKSLMMVNPREQRGIHCRFGMRSIIAEAHFDGSRNAVVMIGGLRRWILAHPNQCNNMHMYGRDHPSGRHSAVDWSKPDLEKFPNFAKLMGNEVILQPGDFLYVPTYWIHYIVSLNVNFQCNTRSGASNGYDKHIRLCGF